MQQEVSAHLSPRVIPGAEGEAGEVQHLEELDAALLALRRSHGAAT